jgi:hypothetical protein
VTAANPGHPRQGGKHHESDGVCFGSTTARYLTNNLPPADAATGVKAVAPYSGDRSRGDPNLGQCRSLDIEGMAECGLRLLT